MSSARVRWAALVVLVASALQHVPAPVVRTRSGRVRGVLAPAGNHYQYFGVPYAAVDRTNRFQAPLPPPTWEDIYDAVDGSVRCPQRMVGSVVVGDPDCLKLNIYTPVRANQDQLLPVMVYIHGGCFFEGTGSAFLYGGDYLVEKGVVIVGVNYRLNVEGFLCLGIKEAPGNAGLKDQIAALKWIRDDIKAFGGDPNSVTLFGESAGAVSTSLLVLSPAARGLFHRAILQSGSSLAPWAIQHDPIKTASNLVKELGYDTKDPHEIYNILSHKAIDEVINAIKYSENKHYITAETLFVPCVEKEIDGVEAVITRYPAEIILANNYTKVPMIIGYNDKEGIYFVARDYGLSLKDVDPVETLQPDLVFPTDYDRNATVKNIMEHYFSHGKDDMITDMIDLYSDLHFKFPSVIEAELYSLTSEQPKYYYLFKYSGYINMPKIISMFGGTAGASHADELFYMFKPYSFPLPQRYLETEMIQRMVTLWTNFAKYSDPTPASSKLVPRRWRASRERNPVALVIDRKLTTAPLWDPRAVLLWNRTYSTYRRKTYGFTSR